MKFCARLILRFIIFFFLQLKAFIRGSLIQCQIDVLMLRFKIWVKKLFSNTILLSYQIWKMLNMIPNLTPIIT